MFKPAVPIRSLKRIVKYDGDRYPDLGYDLHIYDDGDNPRYTMTGQVGGFGNPVWGWNNALPGWLQSRMDADTFNAITFDPESGQFFCYSDDLDALMAAINLMDDTLDEVVKLTSV